MDVRMTRHEAYDVMSRPVLYPFEGADPRITALGPCWIRVGGITADDGEHPFEAEPGTVLTAQGTATVPSGGTTIVLRRWWTLRVTGNTRRDYATLAVMPPAGSAYSTGTADITGVILETTSDTDPGGTS